MTQAAWSDITDRFAIVDEHLVFVDAPLEGYLRELDSGDLFAFRCSVVVPGLLWHWVLVPVRAADVAAESAFDAAGVEAPARWMSILEDHRGAQPQLSAAWISSIEHAVP